MDNENQRELDVLAALEGIHRMQESIRDTELDIVVETGIIFLRLHYQRLPPGVARRLTEISPRDVAEVSEAPAHKTYPTVFIDPAKDILPENKKELGCLESANQIGRAHV